MSDYENFQQTNSGPAPQPDFPGYDFSAIERNGGVMEVRVSSQPHQAPLVDPATRSNVQTGLGGITTVVGGRVQHSPAVQTVNTSELTGGQTGFLATARNNGFPAMGNLKPESVVQYQGMEISLAQMEALGIVRRTATGYEEATPFPPPQSSDKDGSQSGPATAPQGLPEGVELFPDVVEDAVSEAIAPIPQHLYDRAIAEFLVHGAEGVSLNDLAHQSGLTPEEARNRMQFVERAFGMQADHIAKTMGAANPQDCWDWAAANRREKLANVHRELVFGRKTTALRALVTDYFQNVPHGRQPSKEAGIRTAVSASGQKLVNVQGIWTTPEAAARISI